VCTVIDIVHLAFSPWFASAPVPLSSEVHTLLSFKISLILITYFVSGK